MSINQIIDLYGLDLDPENAQDWPVIAELEDRLTADLGAHEFLGSDYHWEVRA